MKRILFAITALLGMSMFSAPPAEAGGFGIWFGNRGHYGHRHYGNYYRGYSPRWHDTSHYDYHPGRFYRHYNHYHYQPGHYHFHRQGHWHY